MLRTVVATGIVLVAVACGSKVDKPAPTGPAYTPIVANGLRGLAADCKTTQTGTAEQLRCTSTKGLIEVSLESGRFRSLTITLRSMILPEAKSHLSHALKDILGAQGVEEMIAKLTKMQTGDREFLGLGPAKVLLVAGGTSKIAPEYKVEINWE